MNERNRNRLEYAACLMVLVLLPWTIIGVWALQDTVPRETANYYSLSNEFDPHNQRSYSQYAWMHAQIKDGESLLWNPSGSCGHPFFASVHSRVLSPFSLPFYFIKSLKSAIRWSIYLKLLTAGLCAFFMARKFGLHLPLALYLASSFQLSLLFISGAVSPITDSLVWFPLLLVLAEQFLYGKFRMWPLTALVFALMILGGFIEGVIYSYLYLLLYLFIRSLRAKQWMYWLKATTVSVLSILFSIALCAVILLPWYEQLGEIEYPLGYLFHISWTMASAGLYFLLFGPIQSTFWHAHFAYAGITGILLFALWMSIRRFTEKTIRRRVEAILIVGILMTFIMSASAYFLPGSTLYDASIKVIGFPAFILGLFFMAARSAEEWNALETEACKSTLKRLPIFGLLWWGTLLLLAIFFYFTGPFSNSPILDLCFLIVSILFMTGLLYRTLFTPSIRVMGYSLVLLTFFPFWIYHIFVYSEISLDRHVIDPENEALGLIQLAEDRMDGADLMDQFPYYVPNVDSVNRALKNNKRHYKFINQAYHSDPLLLRRANVSNLLLEKEDIVGPYADIRPDLRIEKIFDYGLIYFKDLKAEPRARMIYAGRKRSEETPLSSNLPPLLEGGTLPEADDGPVAKVTITEESNTEVKIQIEETRAGVLVLADTFYPGWHALVDGKPAAIFPVDILFRGVEVGEGAHEVIFYYDPFSLKLGKIISAIALLICLFSLRHLIRWKKKHPLDMRTL